MQCVLWSIFDLSNQKVPENRLHLFYVGIIFIICRPYETVARQAEEQGERLSGEVFSSLFLREEA